ncbi:MAG: hypothetical protein SOZ34_02545 [Clostridia bacterium]|nr:hypothetical protein [Clostridia bacterium]
MKKVRLIYFTLIIMLIYTAAVSASNELPVYEDFSGKIFKKMPGWSKSSMAPKTDRHYVRVEDGRLILSVGKVEDLSDGGGDVWPFLRLSKPATGGVVTFEFTINIPEDSCFASYHGLGGIYSSDNQTATPTAQGIAVYSKSNMIFSSIQVSDKIALGRDVRICQKINLDEGWRELLIDGEKIVDANGNSRYSYSGKDIQRVSFNISGSTSGDGKVYIDDVYIYTDEKMIFVSSLGNDENDGTYDNPVKSFDMAVKLYENQKAQNIPAQIILKSGEYELPKGFVYSKVTAATSTNHAVINPIKDAKISISGADAFLDSSLLPNIKEDYKNAILNKTALEYPSQIDVRGPELLGYTILESNTGITYTVEVSNKSSINQSAVMVTAVYENGKMQRVYTDKLEFLPYSKSTKTASHELSLNSLVEYKIFMIDNLNSITPFEGYYFDGIITKNVDFVNRSKNLITVNEEGTYRSAKMAVLDMEILRDSRVAIKTVNNENNEIGYLHQITQPKGNLTLTCAGSCLLGNSTIYLKGVSIE